MLSQLQDSGRGVRVALTVPRDHPLWPKWRRVHQSLLKARAVGRPAGWFEAIEEG
jgi:hypothetical protein